MLFISDNNKDDVVAISILSKADIDFYKKEINDISKKISKELNTYYNNAVGRNAASDIYDIKDYTDKDRILYGLYYNEIFVGIVSVNIKSIKTDQSAYISLIGIDKKYRRNGIAEKALLLIFKDIKEKHSDCLDICLNVLINNQSALSLYKKLGFSEISKNMFLRL